MSATYRIEPYAGPSGRCTVFHWHGGGVTYCEEPRAFVVSWRRRIGLRDVRLVPERELVCVEHVEAYRARPESETAMPHEPEPVAEDA